MTYFAVLIAFAFSASFIYLLRTSGTKGVRKYLVLVIFVISVLILFILVRNGEDLRRASISIVGGIIAAIFVQTIRQIAKKP